MPIIIDGADPRKLAPSPAPRTLGIATAQFMRTVLASTITALAVEDAVAAAAGVATSAASATIMLGARPMVVRSKL